MEVNEIETPLQQQQGFVETDKRLNSRLLQYHGLSAMNTTIFKTWDSYFKLVAGRTTDTNSRHVQQSIGAGICH